LPAWDLKKRCRVLEVGFDRETRVLGLLMPEEGTLVASHADGRLRVWTLDGKGAAATEHRVAGPGRLAASPVAGTLFCAGAGLRWVNWRSGETRAEFTLLRNSAPQSVSDVSALAVGSDGERLFSGHGGEILEWNPRKGSLVGAFPFELSAGRVTRLALNAAGTQLLSGHETGTVLEWTLASRVHRVLLPPPKRRPTAVLAC